MSKDTLTLGFTREITRDQMSVLRTLALLKNMKLENYLYQAILSFAMSDVDSLMVPAGPGYKQLEQILSC